MSAPAKCFLVVLLWLPLQACGLSGGPVEGIVLEETTNAPLPGAIVVARWKGSLFAFAESQTVCVHVESTTTDRQGHYRLPSWHKKSEIGWVRDLTPTISVYRPGYQETGTYENGTRYLRPFSGTRKERLDYLMRVLETTRCGSQDESERSLHTLYTALHEEGKHIAVTDSENEIVDTLRYWTTFVLFDPNKPSTRDSKGRSINIEYHGTHE